MSMLPAWLNAAAKPAAKPLKILILGGTGFLGPHTVEYALARGHDITLFNRGKTNLGLFPNLETIIGDRDPEVNAGLSGLEGRQWDAVIDNSGYVPRMVDASARLLAENTGQYLFVSTICQYDNWIEGGQFGTEERPRAVLEDPATEDVSKFYCELKAYCERSVEEVMGNRVTQIRPGLIVGPLDKSDRYTYWPVRMDRGGEVLAPGKPSDLTQYVDVRDLAKFMVHCVERNLTGAFNAVSMPMPWGEFLEGTANAVNPGARLTWVPAEFLEEQDVQPWRDLHMWADRESPMSGSLSWSSQKAVDAGMTFRPVEETARDTLAWFKTLPEERRVSLRTGLSTARETEVLAAWHAKQEQT
ncbi:MAG: NAD-dependent epimerase/dehydratase family protein [Xanthomonadales bacterium]|nr:NAD-dependent epimerase/dehydratase family protein [Xanthomonadales bacterium]